MVLDQQEHLGAAQRGDPRLHREGAATQRAPGQLQADLPDDAVAPHGADQFAELDVGQIPTADQAQRAGRRARCQDCLLYTSRCV